MYVGENRLPSGHQPLLLLDGELIVQTSSGSVQTLPLDTHDFLITANQQTAAQVFTVYLTTELSQNYFFETHYLFFKVTHLCDYGALPLWTDMFMDRL